MTTRGAGQPFRPSYGPDHRPVAVSELEASLTPSLFAVYASRGHWKPQAHLSIIDDALIDCVAEGSQRVIVEIPPRHGKSEMTSRFGPAWVLGVRPEWRVILASYEATFAASWGGKARDLLLDHGDKVFHTSVRSGSEAKDRWSTAEGGEMITAGVGGRITGMGANVLVIDDPVKNASEARSVVVRESTWDWYISTARTRLEPGGSVVVVMTRWHEDDLVGRLLAEQGTIEEGGEWRRIRIPALAEADDPLGREPGDPLWPERFNLDALAKVRTDMGGYWWNSLYQQRPAPEEGGIFKRENWVYYREAPAEFETLICSWDFTFKDSRKSDWVVGQVWGRVENRYYLLHQVRQRAGYTRAKAMTREVAEHCYVTWGRCDAIYVEEAANGPAILDDLRDELDGLIGVVPEGSKEARAESVAPLQEAHQLYLPEASLQPWVSDYVEECASFPNGANDDQVDATSQALRRIRLSRVEKVRTPLR